MSDHPKTGTDIIHVFCRLPSEVNATFIYLQMMGYVCFHLRHEGRYFWLLCHQNSVDVTNLEAFFTRQFTRASEENSAVHILPFLVVIGEKPTYVGQISRPTYRIGNSVEEDICITMSLQTFLKGDFNARQNELAAFDEPV